MATAKIAELPRLTAEDQRFLADVRAFVHNYWPPQDRAVQPLGNGVRRGVSPAARAWFDALAARGWTVPHWPLEHGGTGWSAARLYLWSRELALAGAPAPDHAGTHWAGPALCAWGAPAQQARFLPGIRSAGERWCLGLLEPDAGADPGEFATRARSTPDGSYRVDGHKAWVAGAADARFMLALARTADANDSSIDARSLLIVDLATPGVTVKPLDVLDGTAGICRVEFTAAVVPADQRLGPEGAGAGMVEALTASATGHVEPAAALRLLADVLVEAAAELPGDEGPLLADAGFGRKLAELGVDLAGLEALELRYLWERPPDHDQQKSAPNRDREVAPTQVLELRHRSIARRLGELFVEAFGYYSLPNPDPRSVHNEGPIGHEYALAALQGLRASRSLIVAGGSDDTLRDHIARRLLEL
jgi:alkylation response protein AidB-like acyl-CoA dehydrogenase